MFHCDRYNCTMEEKHCVRYREIAASAELGAVWIGDPAGRGLTMDRSKCLGCPQGAEIAAGYKPQNVGAGFIPAREEESIKKRCIIEGCNRNVVGQGLCGPHYDKWRRGDPPWSKPRGPSSRWSGR